MNETPNLFVGQQARTGAQPPHAKTRAFCAHEIVGGGPRKKARGCKERSQCCCLGCSNSKLCANTVALCGRDSPCLFIHAWQLLCHAWCAMQKTKSIFGCSGHRTSWYVMVHDPTPLLPLISPVSLSPPLVLVFLLSHLPGHSSWTRRNFIQCCLCVCHSSLLHALYAY